MRGFSLLMIAVFAQVVVCTAVDAAFVRRVKVDVEAAQANRELPHVHAFVRRAAFDIAPSGLLKAAETLQATNTDAHKNRTVMMMRHTTVHQDSAKGDVRTNTVASADDAGVHAGDGKDGVLATDSTWAIAGERKCHFIPKHCMNGSNASNVLRAIKGAPTCDAFMKAFESIWSQAGDIDESWKQCSMVQSGSFDCPPAAVPRVRHACRSCAAPFPYGFYFGNTFGYGESSTAARAKWHEPADIPMGGVFFFRGNSMTRHVFQRLIAWMRNIPYIFEHYYHENAWYAFDRAKDHWQVGGWPSETLLREKKFIPEETLLLLFTFTQPVVTLKEEKLTQSVRESYPWARITGGFLQHALESHAEGVLVTKPNWVVTRLGDGKIERMNLTDPRDDMSAHRLHHVFPLRNAKAYSLKTGVCADINDAHFQCGLQPIRSDHEPIDFVKFPANGDCSDMLSLNFAQRFLQFQHETRS